MINSLWGTPYFLEIAPKFQWSTNELLMFPLQGVYIYPPLQSATERVCLFIT